MHPASSIVIFTTFSGLGFGLIIWLGLGFGPFPINLQASFFAWFATIFAFIFTSAGLLASTFHLGHPERAFRALTQWRSSWLSREGVLAIITLITFGLYAFCWLFLGLRMPLLGLAASAWALATVYATAMIYAQLKTVPRWNTWLTPVKFCTFSLASGFLALVTLEIVTGYWNSYHIIFAMAFLCLAWSVKGVWWANSAKRTLAAVGLTPQSALGLREASSIGLLEAPHSSPNYLMREMVFRVARKHALKLRYIALFFGVIAPLILLSLVLILHGGWLFAVLALFMHIAGILIGRWLFFAEAEHSVSLYYGYS